MVALAFSWARDYVRPMYRSVSMIVLVAVVASCGSTQKRPRLSATDIASSSMPAIVTVEAGAASVGTGVVVDASGLIGIPLHIIEGQSVIRVKLHEDPTDYPVTVIAGFDKARDLALLRIDVKRSLPKVQLGDSSAVSAGARVFELGPQGVAEGSITDVRPLSPELTIFQVVAVNAHQWSGPLFNERGEVIGLTVAAMEASGIVMAVPANDLRQLMQRPVALSPGEFAAQTAKPTPPAQ